MDDVTQVALAGAGEDACALARLAALAGCTVRLFHPDPAALERAQERIRAAVEAGLLAGRLGPADKQRALDGILFTSDLDEAVTHADLVLEADATSDQARCALFLALGETCRASAVVATSGGAPEELVDWLPSPGRLVGLVLPPGREDGPLEVVASVETSAHALRVACRFVRQLGREAVLRGEAVPQGEAVQAGGRSGAPR